MEFKYKISICMIVKDEEKFIDKCLSSLKPLLDLNLAELIIVDTGSIDDTVKIAKKYTEKIYFKKWNNNFSEARNYSISFAKGEYIFIMDADQDMDKIEVDKLINLFFSEEYKKYNTYSFIYKNFTTKDLKRYNYFSINLIFKNDGTFRYEGIIHNQPIYKEPIKNLDIYMNHYGYIMTEDIKEKKFIRTATLLKKELEKDYNNIYYIYQLSRSYEMHGDNKEAVVEVERYLKLLNNINLDDRLKINYYHNAAIIYFNSKEYEKCIYYCELMLKFDKELIDCYYLIGKCNFNNIDKKLINFKLYLKYISTFSYEKYAKTNGLEIFSYAYKSNVIIEIIKIKLRIKQLSGIEIYINSLEEDIEKYMLIIKDIFTIYIQKEDIYSLNKAILNIKDKDENISIYYILSKIIVDKGINEQYFLKNLNIKNEEKEILKENIKIEKENQFENLLNFICRSLKLNKVIKVEYCVEYFIEVLNDAKIKEIEECVYKKEIIYILNYLIRKCDMILDYYAIEKENIIQLMEKYNIIVKDISEEIFKGDKEFSNKIDEFNKFIESEDLLKAIFSLKEAINIKPEFSQLIKILKDSIEEKRIKNNNLTSENDILKIKENLIILINNNMNKEALEILDDMEKFYNIKFDIELIYIKVMLKVWDNKINEAEIILEEGCKYYPDNWSLLYDLAYIYKINGKKITALKIYYDILNIQNIDINYIYKDIHDLKNEIEII